MHLSVVLNLLTKNYSFTFINTYTQIYPNFVISEADGVSAQNLYVMMFISLSTSKTKKLKLNEIGGQICKFFPLWVSKGKSDPHPLLLQLHHPC